MRLGVAIDLLMLSWMSGNISYPGLRELRTNLIDRHCVFDQSINRPLCQTFQHDTRILPNGREITFPTISHQKMSILHLPLPSLSSYAATQALQTHLVRHLLSLKALRKPLPPPVILTMELLPTFTFGRRQLIKPEDQVVLSKMATVVKSQRGGLTTYHGPGQVVGYPILDLKGQKSVVRCYSWWVC